MSNTTEQYIVHPLVSELVAEPDRTQITLEEALALIRSEAFAGYTPEQKLDLLGQLGFADAVIRQTTLAETDTLGDIFDLGK